jgi:predicted MFS family arabinose efflux permease
MSHPEKLFNKGFIALNGISFLTFCNMVVFFQFYLYLHTLPISPEGYGLLIAIFSITGLILRPLISPFFHSGNARIWMVISTTGVTLSLLGYSLARDFWSMFLVRSIHGIAYMVLGAAIYACMMDFIPSSKSGQAFGLVTVITLLPLAVIPPILDMLTRHLGGLTNVLNLSATLMLLIFPLSLLIKTSAGLAQNEKDRHIGGHDFIRNLKDYRISLLLLIMLLLYSSFTPVFFFLEGYAKKMGILNPGLFFTLSTLSEIGVRLFAGSLFDRMNKIYLISSSLTAIGVGYLALAHFSGHLMFYGLGIFLGLGWGVVMPVLNALMFDISPTHLRGLNTNLGVQMFQGGFFLGPFLGGMILTHWDFSTLYYFCAILTFGSVGLTFLLSVKTRDSKVQNHGKQIK